MLNCPSLTLITMLEKLPTYARVGVPVSCPVALLKLAQGGRLRTAKLRRVTVRIARAGVNR